MIAHTSLRPHWSDLPRLAGLALLYALFVKLVLTYFSANGVVSIVWPSSGLALAALLLGGRKYWPGIFVGAFAGNLLAGSPALLCAFIATGNTLEALVGIRLLKRFDGFDAALKHPRNFLWLAVAGGAGASVSALIGTTSLLATDVLTPQTYIANLLQWWQGDLFGIVLVTPMLLVWRQAPRGWFQRERALETTLFLALTFLCGQIVFLGWFHQGVGTIARGYWMFLFVAWAAVRFERHGAMLVVGLAAVQALAGAHLGVGFFGADIVQSGLQNFWFYFLVLAAVGISLATLIAERNFVEGELRHEQQLSADIIDSLPGVFYMLDDQGRFVRWNPRLLAVSGYSDDAMAGKPALELIAERDRAEIAAGIQRVFATGESFAEAGLLGKQGSVTPYHFTGRRTTLEGRVYLVGLGEDITERKAAEDEIRRLNTAYATLSETNQIIVRLHSAAELYPRICQIAVEFGGYTGAWVGLADAASRHIVPAATAGAVDDYIRRIEVAMDDTRPEGLGPTARALRTGRPCFCQDFLDDPLTAPWHDMAQRFGIRASAALPLLRGGKAVGVLTLYAMQANYFDQRMQTLLEEMASDVSFALDNFDREAARAAAEAEVLELNRELERRVHERTADLETANRNLEAFSYSVSHDLRAPLRAINGFAGLLVDNERDHLTADGRHMLDRIAHNAIKLGDLIDSILEYSRAGRLPANLGEVDLATLAQKTANELRESHPTADIRIGALPRVRGDATMLRQILGNLLGNACKYAAKRNPPIIELGARSEGGETVFFVKDNGVGFDMRYAGKLFGMFQRLHNEADFQGSGVGLAIVKRLVERHGGSIWAEAEIDRGATFYFKLGKPS